MNDEAVCRTAPATPGLLMITMISVLKCTLLTYTFPKLYDVFSVVHDVWHSGIKKRQRKEAGVKKDVKEGDVEATFWVV